MTRTRIPLLTGGAVTALLVGAIAAAVDPPPAMFRFDAAHTGIAPGPAGPALSGLRWKFATQGAGPQLSDRFRRPRLLRERRRVPLRARRVERARSAGRRASAARSRRRRRSRALSSSPRRGKASSAPSTSRPDARSGGSRPDKDAAFAWGWDFWLSSPAVSGRTVFIGAGDGNVYALELASGRKLWQFSTGGRVRSTPAVADGVVYVGSMDGRLYALDAASGRKIWAFETEGVTIDVEKAGFDRRLDRLLPRRLGDLSCSSDLATRTSTPSIERRERSAGASATRSTTIEGNPEVSWVLGSPALSGGLVLTGSSDGHFFNALTARGRARRSGGSRRRTTSSPPGRSPEARCSSGARTGTSSRSTRRRAGSAGAIGTGGAVISSPAVAAARSTSAATTATLYALATGPERAGARTRRAVYWKDSEPRSGSRATWRVKDYLRHGGIRAARTTPGSTRWLADDSEARRVRSSSSRRDSLPADAFAGAPEATPFRTYPRGGRPDRLARASARLRRARSADRKDRSIRSVALDAPPRRRQELGNVRLDGRDRDGGGPALGHAGVVHRRPRRAARGRHDGPRPRRVGTRDGVGQELRRALGSGFVRLWGRTRSDSRPGLGPARSPSTRNRGSRAERSSFSRRRRASVWRGVLSYNPPPDAIFPRQREPDEAKKARDWGLLDGVWLSQAAAGRPGSRLPPRRPRALGA